VSAAGGGGGGGGGGAAAVTVTVTADWTEPLALVATSVYVVSTVGDTIRDPFALTGDPSSVIVAAFDVDHCRVLLCPPIIEDGIALSSAVGIGAGGGGVAVTVTIDVSVAEPAALVATRVYVVVTVGEYVRDPFNATATPFIVTDTASVVVQFNVIDWPF
jgi:hypothetical protein